jgi:hypothetical protein
MTEAQIIADRYVALWSETDAERRRAGIHAFFAADAAHFIGTREAIGFAALEQRIRSSHEKNVRDGGFRFRARPGAQRLRNVVTFYWEMIDPREGDRVTAVGLEFVTLNDDSRAILDYQFILA